MTRSTKAKTRAPFPIRMLWATTDEQREKAAELGCNWALVHTLGHRENDFPTVYPADKKVAALRRRENSKTVALEKRVLRHAVDHAHKLGLKAMIHCYELSIPEEFRTVYPRLYRPEIKEYRNASPAVRRNRQPCPADPRIQEIVSEKTAEIIRVAPEMDAYAFCFNECLSKMTVRHRCENCRDIPFPKMIKFLADAVRDGIRSVSSDIRFYHRMWGLNEHDDAYYLNHIRQWKFMEGYGEDWIPGYAKAFKPARLHYKPSRDLPRYLAMQKDEDMGFIAKATWADVSIDHPLNPWIEQLTDHDTIVELSWEQSVADADSFHVLARQLKRMAQYSRRCGATGLAGIPCQWGYKPEHHGPDKGTISNEAYHKLSVLNLDVFRAVMNNPDIDVARVLAKALKARYGKTLPSKLVDFLIESQAIKAGIVNIRGIRGNGVNMDRMFHQLMRYAPTWKDWQQRLSRNPRNVKRVLKEKQATIQRAQAIVDEIKAMEGRIPEKAYRDFLASFSSLRDRALAGCRHESVQFLLWAMKDGTIPCNMESILKIEANLL